MTNLRIQLLGGFSLTSDGKQLLSGRHTSRMALLVAFLALTHGRRQSRKQLASTFWPDSTDLQARNNLRSLLTLLRRHAPELTPYLQDEDAYLRWRIDPTQEIDVAGFESTLQQAVIAEQDEDAALIDTLKKALSLYAGELLPGHYEDWVLAERERLQAAYLNTLFWLCLLYTSPSPRDRTRSRMPSSA